jgi:hypothetical protein
VGDPARLAGLRDALLDAVAGFAALPAAGPGRRDAAFCLFLHVHASSPLRLGPEWPAAAVQLLGLSDTTGETGKTGTGPGR